MSIYIDNSTLAAVAKCSTQALVRYGLGLTDAEERAELKCGQAWHSAMECHLKRMSDETAWLQFMEEYKDWANANVPEKHRLSYDNVQRILWQWLGDHPLPEAPYRVEPDMVECGFAYPLDEHGDVMFVGRYDAAVQARDSDDWYVLDHKTTGRIEEHRVRKYQLDSQMSGYIWALSQMVPDKVQGAFINMIELKRLPSDTRRKCKEHGVKYNECGILHTQSQLFVVQRTPEQIEQWRQTALGLVEKYAELLQTNQITAELQDRTRLSCIDIAPMEGSFNNACEWCEFQQYCAMGRPVDLMQANLVYEPWTPWKDIAIGETEDA